jgi:hypothetical protein
VVAEPLDLGQVGPDQVGPLLLAEDRSFSGQLEDLLDAVLPRSKV